MNSPFQRYSPSLPPELPWWAGILPWVVFGITQEWSPLSAAPLAFTAFVLLYGRRWRTLPPLDAGMVVYFFICSIINFTGLAQQLPPRLLFALCPAVLAVTAALSVLLGRPFTFAYARRYAPEHIRARRTFFQANQILTLLWAIGFATAAFAVGTLPAEWKPAQAAFTLISVMAATVAASVIIGLLLHIREIRVPT